MSTTPRATPGRALVTGGGGFLGRAVVEALLSEGWEVTSVSRGAYPELQELGVHTVACDLADAKRLADAVAGHDVVFHVAAKAGVWGTREEYWSPNVDGTRNLLLACMEHGIQRFVHTSSPSVCFDGKDHRRVQNDLPYASRYICHYPESKASAERLVLSSNGRGSLATCALRPHLIFGPRDPHLIPRILDRARRGRLAIVGKGDNEVSLTYVENAAWAHVDAARELTPDAPHAGKAYFIAQEEPVQLWDWIQTLLSEVGVPPVRRRVPRRLAYAAGGGLELVWNALNLPGEPPMTRFVASQLGTSHSYDLEPARRDFGYHERVPMSEANQRLYAWLRETAPAGSGA